MDFKTKFEALCEELRIWRPSTKIADPSKAKVIDFFCGCGGMSLGFDVLNNFFDVILGIDINKTALKSYNKNFKCDTMHKDIREISNEDIIKIKQIINSQDRGTPLIVIGCAPCQGFSAHRKKDFNKPEDSRNSLISIFIKVALKLRPDYIIMENVKEVLNGKYKNHYEEAKKLLQQSGYHISQKIYNAASFYVPQARTRAIIVAAKKEFSLPDGLLKEENFKTVKDAIGNLPPANSPSGKDAYHYSSKHKPSTVDIISKVPKNGGSRPSNVGPKCLDNVNGFYDVYGRLSWDKPSITITKTSRNPASGRFSHPEENRGLTLREVARLQSFPDNFCFEGGFSERFEQVGEAVPPLLSLAVALQIYNLETKTNEV